MVNKNGKIYYEIKTNEGYQTVSYTPAPEYKPIKQRFKLKNGQIVPVSVVKK